MKKILAFFPFFVFMFCQAQLPDHIYKSNIKTVKLTKAGDIYSYPVIRLNSNDKLELHFDDMDGDNKNYYYSFQLCNADWSIPNLPSFDYISGFQSNRISTYRNSSIANTRYMHYQAFLPDRNCMPNRSGNYLLKVFLNNDTSLLAFTKRIFVVDNRVTVAARVMAPIGGQFFRTHQRVQVVINTANARLNNFSQQDLKLGVVQNACWPTSIVTNRPTIYRGNYFEYSDDALMFASGREWRWVNLTSMRFLSDRMMDIKNSKNRTDIFVKPDGNRVKQVDIYYRDNNGLFVIGNSDGNNPYWQSDYAFTHFSYVPPGNRPYLGSKLYMFGELTNYELNDSSEMKFNDEKGVYENVLFLKQGYYNYSYVTVANGAKRDFSPSFDQTEGNIQSTENTYQVLVYYRSFGARADELIGYALVTSLTNGLN